MGTNELNVEAKIGKFYWEGVHDGIVAGLAFLP
jgi:hypothetical protein